MWLPFVHHDRWDERLFHAHRVFFELLILFLILLGIKPGPNSLRTSYRTPTMGYINSFSSSTFIINISLSAAGLLIAAQVVGIVVYENFVTLSLAITHVLQQEQSFAETQLGKVHGWGLRVRRRGCAGTDHLAPCALDHRDT